MCTLTKNIMLFLYHQNTAQVQAGKGDNMKQTLFEIVAENGQVLDHGFRTIEKARACRDLYKHKYPFDVFKIYPYNNGKYGKEV